MNRRKCMSVYDSATDFPPPRKLDKLRNVTSRVTRPTSLYINREEIAAKFYQWVFEHRSKTTKKKVVLLPACMQVFGDLLSR